MELELRGGGIATLALPSVWHYQGPLRLTQPLTGPRERGAVAASPGRAVPARLLLWCLLR